MSVYFGLWLECGRKQVAPWLLLLSLYIIDAALRVTIVLAYWASPYHTCTNTLKASLYQLPGNRTWIKIYIRKEGSDVCVSYSTLIFLSNECLFFGCRITHQVGADKLNTAQHSKISSQCLYLYGISYWCLFVWSICASSL